MNLNESVSKFRSAIERLGKYSFYHTSLSTANFPRGCCDDVSILLAEYLEESGYTNVNLIHGSQGGLKKELQSHDWLLVGSIIVDITADQFDWKVYDNLSVIVSEKSEFHASFDQVDKGRALDTERSTQRRGEFCGAYSVIKLELLS